MEDTISRYLTEETEKYLELCEVLEEEGCLVPSMHDLHDEGAGLLFEDLQLSVEYYIMQSCLKGYPPLQRVGTNFVQTHMVCLFVTLLLTCRFPREK